MPGRPGGGGGPVGTYLPAETWHNVYSNLLPQEGYLKIKPTRALSLLNACRVVYFSPSLLEKLLHGVLRKVTNVSVVFSLVGQEWLPS